MPGQSFYIKSSPNTHLVNHIRYLGKSVGVANETKALGISKHLGEMLLLLSIQNRTWI